MTDPQTAVVNAAAAERACVAQAAEARRLAAAAVADAAALVKQDGGVSPGAIAAAGELVRMTRADVHDFEAKVVAARLNRTNVEAAMRSALKTMSPSEFADAKRDLIAADFDARQRQLNKAATDAALAKFSK